MSLFLVVVGIKVFELQYIKGDKYKKLAEVSTIKNDTIFANKGNVYAADGNLLATSLIIRLEWM
jgi:cell division protein FtsI (penicillin-binding protein 3)